MAPTNQLMFSFKNPMRIKPTNSLSLFALFICSGALINQAYAQATADETPETWSVHAQATYINQQKNNFSTLYHGENSLLNKSEGSGKNSYSFSATAFLGTRLWDGAEAYYNAEMFQGVPFGSQLVGLGGFQNGELQKGAFTSPVYYNARAFVRQTFGLGGDQEFLASEANQLAGHVDKNRLVFSFGKFNTLDFFDDNTYSHDPRTQFQNFAIFSMGAYGYAADTKGFTYGAVMEWYQGDWIARIARLALPSIPNTSSLDHSLSKHYGDQIEVTRAYQWNDQPGAIRALYYEQHAFMGGYQDALNAMTPNTIPDITAVRQNGTKSWGYGLNWEQALNSDVGLFARWSQNPGKTETQTLDISRSLSGGLSIKGSTWSRPDDIVGIGFAVNGISAAEINYLKQGGYTAFIGDGQLSYKNEQVFEAYYNSKIYKELYLTVDYQRIANPAYNSSRGPIHILGLRAHIEM